jgi:DNA-binding NtrC family response regulator
MMDEQPALAVGTARSILLFCDAAEHRQKLGNLLNEHGYRIIYAENIQQAVDSLATRRIDMVYMDLADRADARPDILERLKHHLDGIPLVIAIDTLPYQTPQPVVFIQRPIDPEMLLRIIHFPSLEVGQERHDQMNWLSDVNASLRAENTQLYDAIALTGHEWRNSLAQIDILLAKLSHPSIGMLTAEHQIIIGQLQEVTHRMEHIAYKKF